MAEPIRFKFKDVRSGGTVGILHGSIMSTAPDVHTGKTTWITCLHGAKFHVTASPEVVDQLVRGADSEVGIEEVVA